MTKMFRTFEFFENSCLFRVSDFDIRILGKNGSPTAVLMMLESRTPAKDVRVQAREGRKLCGVFK
jgi:hypothetical protein